MSLLLAFKALIFLGGITWGITLDDTNVYIGCSNSDHHEWTLMNGTVTKCSGWAAHSKATGEAVWTTANPACYDVNAMINGRYRTAYENDYHESYSSAF